MPKNAKKNHQKNPPKEPAKHHQKSSPQGQWGQNQVNKIKEATHQCQILEAATQGISELKEMMVTLKSELKSTQYLGR